jgi:enoyl-CoA hydratase
MLAKEAAMNEKQDVLIEDMGEGVTQLILNRGPVNALTPQFLNKVAEILDQLEADKDVRAVVISSPLKVFSAGMDLKEAQNFELEEQNAIVKGLNVTFKKLYAFPKPTIAAINGSAIAGGLFFVLASDYRVCVHTAKFGLAEVRVGANFPAGPLEIARDTLSPDYMRRLMLGGKPIGAETALKAGIVDHIADGPEVLNHALAVARNYGTIPPLAFASIKLQIRGSAIESINVAMANGANSAKDGWFTEETKPAMAAMIK